jgi:hypothetical protein
MSNPIFDISSETPTEEFISIRRSDYDVLTKDVISLMDCHRLIRKLNRYHDGQTLSQQDKDELISELKHFCFVYKI